MPSPAPPPRLSIPEPNYLAFLSPSIDAGDASSDDGDTLQTPLTEHDDQHPAYGLYAQDAARFARDVFFPFADKQQHQACVAPPMRLSQPVLSPLSPLSSLMAPSVSEPPLDSQRDTFPSFTSAPDALDLANASLEMSYATSAYSHYPLDPNASPFTPSRQPFELPPFPSSPCDAPPSQPDFSITPLSTDSTCTFPSLFDSTLPSSPRSTLSPSSSAPVLQAVARNYSPRFPAAHVLNPFFVRTYVLGDELGAGGYGFVMTARHRTEGHEVAVKFIIKEKVPEHAWWEDPQVGRIPTEVMLLSLVDHPGIVKCLDLFEDEVYFYLVQELHGSPWVSKKKNKAKQTTAPGKLVVPALSSTPSLTPSASFESTTDSLLHTPPSVSIEGTEEQNEPHAESICVCSEDDTPAIALPILHASEESHLQPPLPLPPQVRPRFSRRASHDLFECIEQSKHKRLSENQARYVFAQVVEAVHYLDTQGITHCDIKDENLLVDSDLKVKLIDFGSAVAVDPALPRPYYTLFFGTTAYASSEILRKQPYRAAPAEVWTLGVLLSYLLTGHSPFPTEQDAVDGRVVLREPAAGRLSRAAVALMGRCLERDPERRADVAEVRGHRWLLGALERGGQE